MNLGGGLRFFLAACAASTLAVSAGATVVTMNAVKNGQIVASGYFSFANDATGVLGFGDLTAFEMRMPGGGSYSLADVRSYDGYSYFAYDTATSQLVTTDHVCGTIACVSSPETIMSYSGELTGFEVSPGDAHNPAYVESLVQQNGSATAIDGFATTTFHGATINPNDVVVTMAGISGPNAVASGFFTYNKTATGTLGFADLSNFKFQLPGGSYSLAQVQAYDGYSYFAYDTASKHLRTASQVCGTISCVDFPETMMSYSEDLTGFEVSPGDALNAPYVENLVEADGGATSIDGFDTFQIDPTAAPVPEPGEWAMIAAGLLISGPLVRRQRRRRGAAA